MLVGMDELISLLFGLVRALVLWRVSVLAIAGAIASVWLSQRIDGFTGYMGIGLTLAFVGFGVLWQGRTSAGLGLTERVPAPKISAPVVFLGLVLVGLFWGGLLSLVFGSTTAAAVLASAPYVVGGIRSLAHDVRPGVGFLTMCATALLVGFGLLFLLLSDRWP